MAHTKSARKRIRQDAKRHLRNQSVKTRVRSLTKKFRASLNESDAEMITQALQETVRELNKAATKEDLPPEQGGQQEAFARRR
jgi:small subunit ribosomal protein S20